VSSSAIRAIFATREGVPDHRVQRSRPLCVSLAATASLWDSGCPSRAVGSGIQRVKEGMHLRPANASKIAWLLGFRSTERREWDSNPRAPFRAPAVFKTGARGGGLQRIRDHGAVRAPVCAPIPFDGVGIHPLRTSGWSGNGPVRRGSSDGATWSRREFRARDLRGRRPDRAAPARCAPPSARRRLALLDRAAATLNESRSETSISVSPTCAMTQSASSSK
jgi:hypothetical protein